MLNVFSWNMTGYISKHPVNPSDDGVIPYVAERIFQLELEPPVVDSLNEYILSALREKNLLYFSFFLHHYEPQLNKRIKGFLGVDGGDLYDTDRFIDIKLSCREQSLLEKRLTICMTCGRVASWKDRPTFEELAVMFEGSTASGAERAYRKAVDKLTELLVAEGTLHAVRLKQKFRTAMQRSYGLLIGIQ